jgi:hypothetical protein
MKELKTGDSGNCAACGEKIRYDGQYWIHTDTSPRHVAVLVKEYNKYDLTKISDTRFATTDFVVEANNNETHCLWNSCQEKKIKWDEDNSGLMINVGEVNDMPVNISVIWAMVDHDMITDWFVRNCDPKYCNGERRAVTDAQNFHLVIHDARDRKPKYYVTGDHPISLRPDKYGLTNEEARAYAKELEKYGFENIEIYLDKKD